MLSAALRGLARRGGLRTRTRPLSTGPTPPDFGAVGYWEEHFRGTKAVKEWYVDAEVVADAVVGLVEGQERWKDRPLRCAHLGSGLSSLGFQLASRVNRLTVTNVDASPSSVDRLKHRLAHEHGKEPWAARVSFVVDDLSGLHELDSAAFELCVDKGALDALEFAGSHGKYLAGVAGLLRRAGGGWFLQVSDAPPDSELRMDLVHNPLWTQASWTTLDVGDGLQEQQRELFMYRCSVQP